MAKCTILRGIPGSGKTYCRRFHEEALDQIVKSFSTDDYFMDQNGNYNFDPSKLSLAHSWNLQRFTRWCQGYLEANSNAVVDNTNISIAEIAPYYALAQAYGHEVVIVTIRCEVLKAVERNIHQVPAEVIFKMWEKMKEEEQRFPPWWQHTVVDNDAK